MKYMTSLILAIIFTFSLPIDNVSAANGSVSITIPKFDIIINHRKIDSKNMQYPLIVYNDITYFPLTWGWCGELGLASGYSEKDGLYINNYSSKWQENSDTGSYQALGSKHKAVIPTYPVIINGRQIDNSKEQFPLLNFRNITYFPLTWRFVVNEFGWDESWDNISGFKLSSQRDLKEHLPGTHYKETSSYITENYRDYAIIEKFIEERSISDESNENREYANNYEGSTTEYYKLDYNTNTITKTESKETKDEPYNSGAVKGENVAELFGSNNGILTFNNKELLNLSEDAGGGNLIDGVFATEYAVNGMKVYLTSVSFTQGSISIPPPYTPVKYYVFIDKGDNILQHLDSWPTDQILSNIYPYGKDGFYLSSKGRIFGNRRDVNGRAIVFLVNSDLSVKILNDNWKDWNSVDAVGTDDEGNLYLLNTWFSDFDNIDAGQGNISPINDGYFRLDLNGKLTKIYPFFHANQVFVTPSGKVYVDANWINAILNLQSGARINLD